MQLERSQLVYAGIIQHEGQLLHAYYELDVRGAQVGDAQLHAIPIGSFEPGDVLNVDTKDHGRVVLPETAKLVRLHRDTAAVSEWRARTGAILASDAAWGAKMPQHAFSCMAPIREAYQRLDEERRGVLIAQMVRFVCEPQ